MNAFTIPARSALFTRTELAQAGKLIRRDLLKPAKGSSFNVPITKPEQAGRTQRIGGRR